MARRALEICHFDPETLEDQAALSCGKACYQCLLDYGNQPDHKDLDRHLIRQFLADCLRLELKPTPFINRTTQGMDFLGYRLYPGRTSLTKRNRLRLRRRLQRYALALELGQMSESEFQERVGAVTAFVDGTQSVNERRRIFTTEHKGGVQAA